MIVSKLLSVPQPHEGTYPIKNKQTLTGEKNKSTMILYDTCLSTPLYLYIEAPTIQKMQILIPFLT